LDNQDLACWFCGSSDTYELCESLDSGSHLQGVSPAICRACGFIAKLSVSSEMKENKVGYEKSLSTAYYSAYGPENLESRSRERALIDYDRSINYIEYIQNFVDLSDVDKVIDIGGAEGLFAAVLKENFPHVNAYNLEPDINAINVGRKMYPDVVHVEGTFEELPSLVEDTVKFDLVTYWGGLYRTVNPVLTLKNLKSRLSATATLFFSFPFMFDDARSQHLKPYGSIKEILGNDSMFMPQEPFLTDIFNRDYKIVRADINQIRPFRKKIPVYTISSDDSKCQQNVFSGSIGKYNDNISYLSNYAYQLTTSHFEDEISQLSEKKFVAWVPENLIDDFEMVFSYAGVNIEAYIVKKRFVQDKGSLNKRIGISEIYDLTPNGIFVYDPDSSLKNQLINRLHLNDLFELYFIEPDNSDPFVTFNDKRILSTALSVHKA